MMTSHETQEYCTVKRLPPDGMGGSLDRDLTTLLCYKCHVLTAEGVKVTFLAKYFAIISYDSLHSAFIESNQSSVEVYPRGSIS